MKRLMIMLMLSGCIGAISGISMLLDGYDAGEIGLTVWPISTILLAIIIYRNA